MKDKKLALDWLLRARSFFTPTSMEKIVTTWANALELHSVGAYSMAESQQDKAIDDALAREEFELVLAMLKGDSRRPAYTKARESLEEIHVLTDLLATVRTSLMASDNRDETLISLSSHPVLAKPASSTRALELQASIRFRVSVGLRKYEEALEFASDLQEANLEVSNEDVLRTHLHIANLYLILGQSENAKTELWRVMLLRMTTSHLRHIKEAECILLMLAIALDKRDVEYGSQALRLLGMMDHNTLELSLGQKRHARLCSVALCFATLSSNRVAGEELIEANALRIKKQPENYHWLEVAAAGFYLLASEWDFLPRFVRRLAGQDYSETGKLLSRLIASLLDSYSGRGRTSVLREFDALSKELPKRELAVYPTTALVELLQGSSWNEGGDVSFVPSHSFKETLLG